MVRVVIAGSDPGIREVSTEWVCLVNIGTGPIVKRGQKRHGPKVSPKYTIEIVSVGSYSYKQKKEKCLHLREYLWARGRYLQMQPGGTYTPTYVQLPYSRVHTSSFRLKFHLRRPRFEVCGSELRSCMHTTVREPGDSDLLDPCAQCPMHSTSRMRDGVSRYPLKLFSSTGRYRRHPAICHSHQQPSYYIQYKTDLTPRTLQAGG